MIIALIPARKGSKRVKDKNIRMLGGAPLLAHSIITARTVPEIDAVYLSTDSELYGDIGKSYGAEVIIRPPELAQDGSTDLDVIENALSTRIIPPVSIQDALGQDFIVYLRPTTPFRTTTIIQKAIQTFKVAGENASSLRSVEEMGESCYKCFLVEFGYIRPLPLFGMTMELANSPNHMVPITYRGNGYVDILKGPAWGDKVIGFVTPKTVEIDTEDDWRYAEWYMAYRWTREEIIFR